MNKITVAILFFFYFSIQYSNAQNPNYDAELAIKLEADSYGMKTYTFVLLSTGPVKIENKKIVDSLFAGHMANINYMVDAGKLIIAGPFMKNEKSLRGLFILNTKDQKEIDLLLEKDPAIKEGLLKAETFAWYGSAALPMYLPYSEKIWTSKP